jgi:hypothetical protein
MGSKFCLVNVNGFAAFNYVCLCLIMSELSFITNCVCIIFPDFLSLRFFVVNLVLFVVVLLGYRNRLHILHICTFHIQNSAKVYAYV